MNKLALIFVLAVFAIGLGCKSSTEPEEKEKPKASLYGTWKLTKFEVTNLQNTQQKADLVAMSLASGSITLESTGKYEAQFTLLGQPSTETGTVTVKDDSLIIDLDSSDLDKAYQYSINENKLTLNGTDQFDINFDGVKEPVAILLVLEKVENAAGIPLVLSPSEW